MNAPVQLRPILVCPASALRCPKCGRIQLRTAALSGVSVFRCERSDPAKAVRSHGRHIGKKCLTYLVAVGTGQGIAIVTWLTKEEYQRLAAGELSSDTRTLMEQISVIEPEPGQAEDGPS